MYKQKTVGQLGYHEINKTLILLHSIQVQQHHIPSYQNPPNWRVLPTMPLDYHEKENIHTLTVQAWIWYAWVDETHHVWFCGYDEAWRRGHYKWTHTHWLKSETSRPLTSHPKSNVFKRKSDRENIIHTELTIVAAKAMIGIGTSFSPLNSLKDDSKKSGLSKKRPRCDLKQVLWIMVMRLGCWNGFLPMGVFYMQMKDNINKFERVKITYQFINGIYICRLFQQAINLLRVAVNKLIVSWYIISGLRFQVTTIKGNPSQNLVLWVQ